MTKPPRLFLIFDLEGRCATSDQFPKPRSITVGFFRTPVDPVQKIAWVNHLVYVRFPTREPNPVVPKLGTRFHRIGFNWIPHWKYLGNAPVCKEHPGPA